MIKAKTISILQFAKLQAYMLALVGIVFGIIYAIGGFIIDLMVTLNLVSSILTKGLSIGTLLAFGALLGVPTVFAIVGYLLGILEALLYNLSIRWFSAINFNIQLKADK